MAVPLAPCPQDGDEVILVTLTLVIDTVVWKLELQPPCEVTLQVNTWPAVTGVMVAEEVVPP